MGLAVARVDFTIATNVFWDDQLQFGILGDTSWSFTGCTFLCDVKVSPGTGPALLSTSTGAGTIVTDDAIGRVLHFLVPDTTILAQLPCGEYHYDLIMVNTATGERDALMYGKLCVTNGVTYEG